MTASPPDMTVDHSSLWAHVTSADDVEAWATPAAEQLWRATGEPFSGVDVERLAAKLRILADAVVATGAFGAFFLVPEPSRGPLAVVRVNGLTYAAGTPVEEVVEGLLLPDALQLVTPQVEHLPSPQRVRLRQRAYEEQGRSISEYLTWVLPFDDAAWLLSVSFPDPRDADAWLPELDALSAGVTVQVQRS